MTPGVSTPTTPVGVPVAPVAAGTVAAAGSDTAVALYDVDPDIVAALVLGCPAVAGLSGGPFGAAATYLPGRTVAGVRISPDTVEVHVVARYGPTIGELAGQVRSVLAGCVLGRTVDIVVEDLADRPDADPAPVAPALPSAATGAVVTTGLAAPPTVLPSAGTPELGTPVPVGASPPAGQVVDPVEVLVNPVEVLASGEVPSALPAPPGPPDPPAVRPSR